MKTMIKLLFVAIILSSVIFADGTPQTAWGKQYGFALESLLVSADKSGNCFIAGTTNDSLSTSFAGKKDAFVRKLDASGNILWTINIGSSEDDYCYAVTADVNGNCYAAGKTAGNIASTNLGGTDAFLVKIDPSGNIIWKKQFGTDKNDDFQFVLIDAAGNCFVTGSTLGNFEGGGAGNSDAILLKLTSNGNVVWQKQYGTTAAEAGEFISLDKNQTAYIILSSKNIVKFDKQGSYVDKHSYSFQRIRGVLLDDSLNIYIGGNNAGKTVFIKYDNNWNLKWQKSFGTGSWTGINSMMKFQDGTGDILVGVCQSWPSCFAVCKRYDTNGNEKWTYTLKEQNGKTACGHLVATDGSGNCFFTGFTDGNLFGTRINAQDVFLSKIVVSTSANNNSNGSIPDKFELNQNYPNPFNPETVISYQLPVSGMVTLRIFDIHGKEIATLVDKYQNAGSYEVKFNVQQTNANTHLASGIYFYKLKAGNYSSTQKMILLK